MENLVDFLSVRVNTRAALDRLLAIAPAVEAAGIPPMSMEETNAEVKAVRAECRNAGLAPARMRLSCRASWFVSRGLGRMLS